MMGILYREKKIYRLIRKSIKLMKKNATIRYTGSVDGYYFKLMMI